MTKVDLRAGSEIRRDRPIPFNSKAEAWDAAFHIVCLLPEWGVDAELVYMWCTDEDGRTCRYYVHDVRNTPAAVSV